MDNSTSASRMSQWRTSNKRLPRPVAHQTERPHSSLFPTRNGTSSISNALPNSVLVLPPPRVSARSVFVELFFFCSILNSLGRPRCIRLSPRRRRQTKQIQRSKRGVHQGCTLQAKQLLLQGVHWGVRGWHERRRFQDYEQHGLQQQWTQVLLSTPGERKQRLQCYRHFCTYIYWQLLLAK